MPAHILVVEDEPEVADLLELYLSNEGYQVSKYSHGKEALDYVSQTPLDLALLDVMLPDMDGFQICQSIRKAHFFPIIMLPARVEDIDKINGLMLGADDYITKPFNPLELTARVRTQLRRYTRYNTAAPQQEQTEKDIRGLHMDKDAHHCSLNGQEVVLTPIEFNILWYLCERQGSVVSSEELFEAVWGEKYLDNNNTVMAHIARIREKLKEPARRPKYIKTVWGVGYTIE